MNNASRRKSGRLVSPDVTVLLISIIGSLHAALVGGESVLDNRSNRVCPVPEKLNSKIRANKGPQADPDLSPSGQVIADASAHVVGVGYHH